MKLKVTLTGSLIILFFVAALGQSAAAPICSQDTYYDRGTEACQPCHEVCNLSDDICKRLCPEFNKPTTAKSCSNDTYYDPKVEACQPCQEICPSSDNNCLRLCPNMVMIPITTTTTTTSSSTTTTVIQTTGGEMVNKTKWSTEHVLIEHSWIAVIVIFFVLGLLIFAIFILWRRGCIRTPTILVRVCQLCQGSVNENTKTPIQEETRLAMPSTDSGGDRANEVEDSDDSRCVLDPPTSYTNRSLIN